MTRGDVRVVVNGTPRTVDAGTTLAALVEEVAPGRTRGVAVALDDEVLGRAEWGRELRDGARVEVLTAVQGG